MNKPTATRERQETGSSSSAQQPASAHVTVHHERDGNRPSEEGIRFHAYLRWEQAGKPPGKDLGFWLEAERELQLEAEQEAARKRPKRQK